MNRSRGVCAITLMLLTAGCEKSGGDSRGLGGVGDGNVSASADAAELDARGRLGFEVTSDVYRRWAVVHRVIGQSAIGRSIVQLGRRALTQRELDAAVSAVSDDAPSRAAIENGGLSAREYVYATIALEQAMSVAKGRLSPRRGGVPAPTDELARREGSEPLRDGWTGDTSTVGMPAVAEVPAMREPLPSVAPVPPSSSSRLLPSRPVPADAASPVPAPRDSASPVPAPLPAQPPTQPIPAPVPAPPPVDTTKAR